MSEVTLNRKQAMTVVKFAKIFKDATYDITEQLGIMRRGVIRTLTKQVRDQITSNRIELSLSVDVINSLIDRTAHHTKQHPNFNPAFRDGYKRPTKPGSQPIDTVVIMDRISKGVDEEFNS